jgi:hypothetical protein
MKIFISTTVSVLTVSYTLLLRSKNNSNPIVDVHDGYQIFSRFILTFKISQSFNISYLLQWIYLSINPVEMVKMAKNNSF